MKRKTQLTKTQLTTLKRGLHGGFLPLLASIAPAILGAIAPKAIDAIGTFGERLFSGKNVLTGNSKYGSGEGVETSANSYILGSGANGAGRRRKKTVKSSKSGAKANPWITHVKAYARKHNLSYGDAIKKARPSYK